MDTDFLVALLRNNREALAKAEEYDSQMAEISTTSMNTFEIYLGAYRSSDPQRNLQQVDNLTDSINILHLTKESSKKSSEILSELISKGTPIDLRDAIIAGIALIEGHILITRNVEHFKRVIGLSIEEW